MPSNLIVINRHMEFEVPDSRMEAILELLHASAISAKNHPAEGTVWDAADEQEA